MANFQYRPTEKVKRTTLAEAIKPYAKKKCNHCNGEIAITNPKGTCDHLYYPENCSVCIKDNPFTHPLNCRCEECFKTI